LRGFDKESINKRVSFFIYNSFSRKLLFGVSFFALDLIKKSRRLKKYYYIILKLQQNKTIVDDKINLFRRNVEEYTRFFIMKLRMNMLKINNDIEYFKQSLFIESLDSNDKNRYQYKNSKDNDKKTNLKRHSANSGVNIGDDRRNLKFGKDLSINSYSESRIEQTSKS
jgi:hypothetical protein